MKEDGMDRTCNVRTENEKFNIFLCDTLKEETAWETLA
jgi:hypothetical protein